MFQSDQDGAAAGRSVAAAGDVNGDSYGDILVGAPLYGSGLNDEGAAFLLLGGPSGFPANGGAASAAARIESDLGSAQLGSAVSGAGDVNGDGFADVVVGAFTFSADQTSEGAAFVQLGNGGHTGRRVLARQLRGDGTAAPFRSGGRSHDPDAFEVRMHAANPDGGGRVKLQVEACPSGVAFGDASCVVRTGSSWLSTTGISSGVDLTERIDGLDEGAAYSWRARVLYGPESIAQAGVTAPPHPRHGPWRRLDARTASVDLRALPEPSGVCSFAAAVAALGLLHSRRRKH